jgi:polysaccharide pyruvyl transferase WcaK-like protein/organic radical activating enzyme
MMKIFKKLIKRLIKKILKMFNYTVVRIQPPSACQETVINQDNSHNINNNESSEQEKSQSEVFFNLSLLQKVNSGTRNLDINKDKKVFFVADNTDTANFGCRGTSRALMDIITSKGLIIHDKIKRNELLALFPGAPVCDDVFQYISTVKKDNSIAYDTIMERINKSDILILNGEGSFIFQSPPRHDMLNMLALFYACIEVGKPFCLLNAMFTSYAQGSPHEEPQNEKIFKQCMAILEHSAIVSARDMISFDLIQKSGANINALYLPDALFSWFDFYSNESSKLDLLLMNYQYCSSFNGISDNAIDFSKKYILMGGNSHAPHHPEKAEKCFSELACGLKEAAQANEMQFFLIECCSGDWVLRQISKNLGIPLIPVETNLRLAGYILGKAACFVSGRYHPSILASLGGAPCVFMGSNSHKTSSLQEVLGIPKEKQVTFNALPDSNEIGLIVNETIKNLKNSRSEIIKKCEKNCRMVKELPIFYKMAVIEKLVVKTGTACSLKCEKCGEFNPYLAQRGKSFCAGAKKLCGDVFRIANNVNMINTVHIAGGEPFIHDDIHLLISSLSYISKIKKIEIVTNGTIIPDEITLSLLASLNSKVIVLISDYGVSAGNKEKLLYILKEREINHHFHKGMVWKDKSDVSAKNRKDLLYVSNNCTAFRKKGYFSLIDGMVTAHCPTAGSLFYYLDLCAKHPDFMFNLHDIDDSQISDNFEKLDNQEYSPACEYCVASYEAKDCTAGVQI